MSEFLKRFLVGLVGIPLAISIIYFGGLPFLLFILLLSSLGIYEFISMGKAKGYNPNLSIGIAANILIVLQVYLFVVNTNYKLLTFSLFIILLFISLTSLMYLLWSKKESPFINFSILMGGLLYVSITLSTLILIRNIHIFDFGKFDSKDSANLVLSIFIAVWTCDTFAYLFGRKLGKHKLFPSVSPKKSWEGAIFGFIGSIIGFTLSTYFLVNGFPLVHSVIIGSLIGVVGQIGDLVESKLKRDAGIKDSSNIIPGHGGILDRFDSIIFVAPIVMIYLFFWILM